MSKGSGGSSSVSHSNTNQAASRSNPKAAKARSSVDRSHQSTLNNRAMEILKGGDKS